MLSRPVILAFALPSLKGEMLANFSRRVSEAPPGSGYFLRISLGAEDFLALWRWRGLSGLGFSHPFLAILRRKSLHEFSTQKFGRRILGNKLGQELRVRIFSPRVPLPGCVGGVPLSAAGRSWALQGRTTGYPAVSLASSWAAVAPRTIL